MTAVRPAAKACRSVSLLKKLRNERITVPTAIFLSSGSTGTAYSCSNRRKRGEPASLSFHSDSICECTAARTSASCSVSEGMRSNSRSTFSIVSWTTLPAHMGSAESRFSRSISASSGAA